MLVEFKLLHGTEIGTFLNDLARLRIQVFAEYPYLYDGDEVYEKKYLATYVNAPGAIAVLAVHEGKIIGVSTGVPLLQETPEVIAPFLATGFDLRKIFYFGESVLLPQYRGQGIGKSLFLERERAARLSGEFQITCFCSVVRSVDDPRRPANYRPLDGFWNSLGYLKHPELVARFSWKEIGEDKESIKDLVFWLKFWGKD